MTQAKAAGSLWRDLAIGAAAGAVGTWLMAPTLKQLTKLQPSTAQRTEREQSWDESATVKLAERVAEPLGQELSRRDKQRAGTAIHWLYGTSWGIGLALLTRKLGRFPIASGLAFGATLWALGDELMVPALKLAPKPQHLPVTTHAKALGAHLAYGAGAELAMRGLRRANDAVAR